MQPNSQFSAVAEMVDCSAMARSSAKSMIPISANRTSTTEPKAPLTSLLRFSDLPALLRTTISDANVSVDSFNIDDAGQWIVFATEVSLAGNDINGLEDVYLFATDTGKLTPISVNYHGNTANGASRQPRIDAQGLNVVFSSEANDLVLDDQNGVSDIYLTSIETGTTERVSFCTQGRETEFPARNPAIGGLGPEILYDCPDFLGYRQIFSYDKHTQITQQLSLPTDELGQDLDNHHPVISSDGRFVAYLETIDSEESDERCYISY
ncbi:MAG: hypothetical protein GY794_01250, partial [bacterium]|nr:hypothetical protein [bacterium]